MKVVLNDEGIKNDYGFRILNSGIDFTRFNGNPVVLCHHDTDDLAIGTVSNIRVEGSQTVADVAFDKEDEDVEVKRLISKYERGIMKAWSSGVLVFEMMSTDLPNGERDMLATKTEYYELSAVTIPSNPNSLTIKLMNKDNTLIPTQTDGKKVTLSVSNGKIDFSTIKVSKMDFKKLASIVGLTDTATQSEVEAKVQALASELTQLHSARVETAIKEGEAKGIITDANRESFKVMLVSNFGATKAILDAVTPVAQTIQAPQVDGKVVTLKSVLEGNSKTDATQAATADSKDTFDYLQRFDSAKLISLKSSDPAKYAQLAADYQKGVRYKA